MTAGVMVRNEWLKARKRLASWVTLGFFVLIAGLGFGSNYLEARRRPDRAFALPDAWPEILGEPVQVAFFFGAILLILLVASEFSWRTARQNVIDGLSKERWFWGKAMLLPLVAVVFVGWLLLVGAGFALAGTDLATASRPLVRSAHAAAAGGALLGFVGYGSLALAAAMAIRSAGAAMGAWFFYAALGERLLSLGLVRLERAEWIRYLPIHAFNAVADYLQWDRTAFGGAIQRAVDRGGTPPQVWETERLLLVVVGWIVFFVVGSFLWFRRREIGRAHV